MKTLALLIALMPVTAFSQPVRNHALATHHTIHGGAGLKKVGKVLIAVPKESVIVAFDSLEASVDALGVSLQFFADALDMGVAAPLEALPKPLNEIGVGVHVVYLGLDKAGEFLAK